MALTERQRRFVEAYMAEPNATRAAEVAGYKGDNGTMRAMASRLLTNNNIRMAINERGMTDIGVANRIDRQKWWTEVMRDAEHPIRDRLKASELLGKTQGDFLEVHNHLTVIGGMEADELQAMVAQLFESGANEDALPAVWDAELDDD